MAHPQKGDKIKVHYTCQLEDGSICDSTRLEGPIELNVGKGEILPAIEHTLLNMIPGESTRVILTPDKAYGQYKQELVTEIDRKEFRDRGIQPEIGLALEIKPVGGKPLEARITDLDDMRVRLDANHPLAGKTLQYDIQLVSSAL